MSGLTRVSCLLSDKPPRHKRDARYYHGRRSATPTETRTVAYEHYPDCGYTCGVSPAGPCDAQHRKWFLPYIYVTRGQLSTIDVLAAGWTLYNPVVLTFTDVPPGSVFYKVIETAVCHGVVSGYNDHTFRPFNNAARGQIAKIVYMSITNPPTTCGPTSTPGP